MHAAALWLALASALVAAAFDVLSRRIPNWLTLGTAAIGLVLQTAAAGPAGLALALAGSVAAGLPALALFRLRAMGGGDVKLLAGCGALLGPYAGLELLLATAVAGGGLALATIIVKRAWVVTGRNASTLLTHWLVKGVTVCPAVSLGRSRGVAVPYGVAVACGMVFTVASRLGAA